MIPKTPAMQLAEFSRKYAPRRVSLFFAQGARLPDPKKLLKGNGNKMRHLVLGKAEDIRLPDVESLIAAALRLAKEPFDPKLKRQLIIKAVAAKQRPRRSAD